MNRATIIQARQAAELFLERSQAALDELGHDDSYITGTKASGALRRTSLDLTRALADMRRAA
jgi:hypothetical protein